MKKMYIIVYAKCHIVNGTNAFKIGECKSLLLKKHGIPRWTEAEKAGYSVKRIEFNL